MRNDGGLITPTSWLPDGRFMIVARDPRGDALGSMGSPTGRPGTKGRQARRLRAHALQRGRWPLLPDGRWIAVRLERDWPRRGSTCAGSIRT